MTSQSQLPLSRFHRWDWLAVFILLVAMQSVAARLVATDWVKDLQIVLTITLLGGILGFALGVSGFSTLKAILITIAYGLLLVPWQLGSILGHGIPWLERIISLWGRLIITLEQIVGKQNVTDPLLFLTLVGTLAWFTSAYASFTLVRRRRVWRSVLPGGIVIVLINIYSYQDELNARFLAFYIFAALLLVARIHLLDRQTHWQAKHIPIPFHINFDLILGTIVAAGLVVGLVWTIPTITETLKPAQESWEKIVSPWDSAREQMTRVFAALKSTVQLVPVGGIKGYYGDELPMGLGIPLSDDLVFSVEAPALPFYGMRYYWRARSYEIYENGVWSNNRVKTFYAVPDQFDVSIPVYEDRWDVKVKTTTFVPISTLYTPAQPYWVSRPVDLQITNASDEKVEIAAMEASPIIMPGEVYEVQAALNATSVQALHSAGTDYPTWVTDKYLQLPDSITPRTLALAEQIAGDLDNPYDQVEAITAYLRTHITYVDELPTPPENQEPIDWMLFDNQEGFCNYYATAEVILARALGIPARVTVGYAQGERQIETVGKPALGGNLDDQPGDIIAGVDTAQKFLVAAKNAHTWPEIFFPGLGWVEFEPTVNQETLLRQQEENSTSSPTDPQADRAEMGDELMPDDAPMPEDESNLPEDLSPFGESRWPFIPGGGNLLFICLLILLFWQILRRYRGFPPLPVFMETRLLRMGLHPPLILRYWARWSALSHLERAFHEINRALARLGQPPAPADTPVERAAALTQELPESAETVRILLQEYQTVTYRTQVADVKLARSMARRIKRHSYRVRIKRLFGKN